MAAAVAVAAVAAASLLDKEHDAERENAEFDLATDASSEEEAGGAEGTAAADAAVEPYAIATAAAAAAAAPAGPVGEDRHEKLGIDTIICRQEDAGSRDDRHVRMFLSV